MSTSCNLLSVSSVVVYGAGGHGRVVMDILSRCLEREILGFVDDNGEIVDTEVLGYPVIGGWDDFVLRGAKNVWVALGIGDNLKRQQTGPRVVGAGYPLATAVHPSAQIGRDVRLGEGTVLMANSAVNTGARIGRYVIVNTGATVDHDCTIEDAVHISPGVHLAGNVLVEERAHLGIGASVCPGVRIGKDTVIGAGAVVISDQPGNCVVVGVPAKVIKRRD